MNRFVCSCNRRDVIRSLVGGSIVLPGIVAELLAREDERRSEPDPVAPRAPHFEPRAKRVIFLFSTGGASHLDTFDHKPKLIEADGKITGAGGGLSRDQKPLLKPQWQFRPGGRCGTMVSDLFPNLRDVMDDVCLVRSMKSDESEHFQSTLAIHTGSFSSSARRNFETW